MLASKVLRLLICLYLGLNSCWRVRLNPVTSVTSGSSTHRHNSNDNIVSNASMFFAMVLVNVQSESVCASDVQLLIVSPVVIGILIGLSAIKSPSALPLSST